MIKRAAGKVMWVGRATVFVVGLAVILALALGVATAALGDSNAASYFKLGQINSSNAISSLVGAVGGPNLKIQNTSTGSNATALELQVPQGKAPMKVNSSAKVDNLNADTVDGFSSTDFYAAGSKVADADKLDGMDSTDFAKSYDHTVVVSPDQNTAERSGVSLLNALSTITDASAFNRYLIHLEPGTYYLGDQGAQSLQMKPFVDIEGSGQNMTRITSEINDADCGFDVDATVSGANGAELRFLTVENFASSSSGCGIAIANNGDVGSSLSPTFTFVSAVSHTGGATNIGIHNRFASPTLTNVTAKAEEAPTSIGVFTRGGSSTMTLKDSTLSSLATSSSTTTIVKDSTLLGSLSNDGTTKAANSQLLGPIENRASGATLQCFNNYDENMAPVTCP